MDKGTDFSISKGGLDDVVQDAVRVVHEASEQGMDSSCSGFPPGTLQSEAQELWRHAGSLGGDRLGYAHRPQDRAI